MVAKQTATECAVFFILNALILFCDYFKKATAVQKTSVFIDTPCTRKDLAERCINLQSISSRLRTDSLFNIFLYGRQMFGVKNSTRDQARKKHAPVTFCVRLANADERQSIRWGCGAIWQYKVHLSD